MGVPWDFRRFQEHSRAVTRYSEGSRSVPEGFQEILVRFRAVLGTSGVSGVFPGIFLVVSGGFRGVPNTFQGVLETFIGVI